jgi:hypothetical protein
MAILQVLLVSLELVPAVLLQPKLDLIFHYH